MNKQIVYFRRRACEQKASLGLQARFKRQSSFYLSGGLAIITKTFVVVLDPIALRPWFSPRLPLAEYEEF